VGVSGRTPTCASCSRRRPDGDGRAGLAPADLRHPGGEMRRRPEVTSCPPWTRSSSPAASDELTRQAIRARIIGGAAGRRSVSPPDPPRRRSPRTRCPCRSRYSSPAVHCTGSVAPRGSHRGPRSGPDRRLGSYLTRPDPWGRPGRPAPSAYNSPAQLSEGPQERRAGRRWRGTARGGGHRWPSAVEPDRTGQAEPAPTGRPSCPSDEGPTDDLAMPRHDPAPRRHSSSRSSVPGQSSG